MKKFIILAIVIAAAGLIGFSLITKQATTKSEFKTKAKYLGTSQQQGNLRQATLRINGMTCDGCATAAKYALKERDGVIDANVNYDSKIGKVVYNPLKISKNEIIQAVSPYTATITEDVLYK